MKQLVRGLFLVVCFFLVTENHILAQTNKNSDLPKVHYLYPANNEKVFIETEDQFYEALQKRSYPVHQEYYRTHNEFYKRVSNHSHGMDIALFKEIPHASINMRKKLLFNEVVKFNYITWEVPIPTTYPTINLTFHQTVSPDRQVYFFYSLLDTPKEFKARYAVYDVETKQLLAGGGTNMNKTIKKVLNIK